MKLKSFVKWIATVSVTLALGACAATYQNHGYIPPEEDLENLVIGVDTRDSVQESIGVPSTSGVLNDSGYYYVRSRVRTFGSSAPKEIERQVLAISFDPDGVVTNIERFALEDGHVITMQSRVSDTAVSDKTFIRQLLGNIGRVGSLNL